MFCNVTVHDRLEKFIDVLLVFNEKLCFDDNYRVITIIILEQIISYLIQYLMTKYNTRFLG